MPTEERLITLEQLVGLGYRTFTSPEVWSWVAKEGLLPEGMAEIKQNKLGEVLWYVGTQEKLSDLNLPARMTEIYNKFLEAHAHYSVSDCPIQEDPIHIAVARGLVTPVKANATEDYMPCPSCHKKYVQEGQEVPIIRFSSVVLRSEVKTQG